MIIFFKHQTAKKSSRNNNSFKYSKEMRPNLEILFYSVVAFSITTLYVLSKNSLIIINILSTMSHHKDQSEHLPSTIPVQVGSIKKGGYVMIKDYPCIVA